MTPLSYNINAAAKATGISRTSIYKLIGTGELPVFKLSGRTLIRVADLQDLIDRKSAQSCISARRLPKEELRR